MLASLALLFILGVFGGRLMQKWNLPSLIAYLVIGLVLGPYFLDLLSEDLLAISPELRSIALIIILSRAGLSLDLQELKKVGRPALLLCFLPAAFEILATGLFAPLLLDFNLAQSLLLGSILAAVSPAVLVPRTIQMIENGLGTEKQIPQMLLAGASADDIFVYTAFAIFLGMNQGESLQWVNLWQIPVSLLSGILIGILAGQVLAYIMRKMSFNQTQGFLLSLSAGFLLFSLEDLVNIPFSPVLAIILANATVLRLEPVPAQELSKNYNGLWKVFEIFLFALLAASLDPTYALQAGWRPIALIALTGIVRALGVWLSLLKTNLIKKEKLFMMMAYIPKATEQAAIGGVPFALGIAQGEMILVVAITSIFLTAPLGAFLVDYFAPRLLEREDGLPKVNLSS